MRRRWLRILPLFALFAGTTLLLATCAPRLSLEQQIRTLGTLRVAMVNSVTTYYLRGDGAAGFEYDLARAFARKLGLTLDVVPVPNRSAAIAAVESGAAHMAAGVAISPARRRRIRFTPPYSKIALDVVYNTQNPQPDNLHDVSGRLTIQSHTALGEKLAEHYPNLDFNQKNRTNAEALMAAVADGKLYSTIANNDLVAINQRYHPQLRVAFTLPDIQRELAWAFPQTGGDGMYNQAVAWLARAEAAGRIHVLRQRYFAHADRLGFVGGQIFADQIKQRLPQWRDLFKRAGKEYDLDWRLLAAMGYQESHWNPDATSPTGVRGLMMLTQATASELGVDNRLDPQQSVNGGARYLNRMHKRLPDAIKEPDRTWMALAAYNIGFGHLMDARRLLKARGRDPNLWANVRTALTWLTEEEYNDDTRYGYAPGYQAVEYVGNIRAYYDILNWVTRDQKKGDRPEALDIPGDQGRAAENGITISSPAL